MSCSTALTTLLLCLLADLEECLWDEDEDEDEEDFPCFPRWVEERDELENIV